MVTIIQTTGLRNLYVKCNNNHGHNYKDIYWYPNKNINLQSLITP